MTTSKKPKAESANFAAEINESFLANINHALRTPLNGLVGMSDLLAKTGLNDGQLRYAHVIRESTEALMLQLDNILELAKIEDGEIIVKSEPCCLEDIIKKALKPLISVSVKQQTPISLDIALDLPDVVEVDGKKLQLILRNLLSCSLKFAERGKIVLKVTAQPDEDDQNIFNLRFTLENSKILHDMLYSAMEETKDFNVSDLRDFGEITVSLLTAQRLLSAMGSGLSFDNMTGNEPPFHFDMAVALSAEGVSPSPYAVINGKRALVFQDDLLDMNMLLQALQLWGVSYRIVTDDEKLLFEIDEAHKEGRSYHLLFCNKALPGTDLAKLKSKIPDIILTTDQHDLSTAFLSEFAACLRPPVYPEELLTTLSTLYQNAQDDQEFSWSEEASQHIRTGQYKKVDAKVMLVEDEFVSRMYAAELLEGFGCTVVTAENGVQALTKFFNNSEYDVIFMDCMMPRLDGYSTTRKIREAGHGDTPIVALTANTLEQDRDKCLTAGMNDYITKPVKEQDLYAALVKNLKK